MNNGQYNGWTNYATWRINLEIFDGMTADDLIGSSLCVSELKDAAEEWVQNHIFETSKDGLARSYAIAFISDVDWWQIADRLIIAAYAEKTKGLNNE
jgi:hypothetical protein